MTIIEFKKTNKKLKITEHKQYKDKIDYLLKEDICQQIAINVYTKVITQGRHTFDVSIIGRRPNYLCQKGIPTA